MFTVKVGPKDGVKVDVTPSQLTINEYFDENSNGSMICIYQPPNDIDFTEYEIIDIYEDAVLKFRGVVTSIIQSPISSLASNKVYYVEFVDNTFYAKALFTRLAFNNETIDEAVTKVVTERIQAEYPFITIDEIDTYTLELENVVSKFQRVDLFLDAIADFSKSYWEIDKDYNFRFKQKSSLPNVGEIDIANNDVYNQSDEKRTDKVRTRQFAKGGLGTTDEQRRFFQGDGANTVYVVDYPIASKPRLYKTTTNPEITPPTAGDEIDPATIGVRGIDDDDASIDWFFSYNSPQISQKIGATPFTSGEYLTADFFGLFQINVETNAATQQNNIAAKLGGTGVIEAIDIDETIRSLTDADNKSEALVDKFKNPEKKLILKGKGDILEAGDIFTYPDRPGEEYLCRLKQTFVTNSVNTDYMYESTEGAYYGTWAEYFKINPNVGNFVVSSNEKLTRTESVLETIEVEEGLNAEPELGFFAFEPGQEYGPRWQYDTQGSFDPAYPKG